MKTKNNNIISLILAVSVCIFLVAFLTQGTKKGDPWKIPAKYKAMKNTFKEDNSLLKVGKMLYSKHCKSCHGSKGLGDGPKAKQLDTFPGDFSKADFKKQADGVLYYKSYIGRDEMPNFEKKIPDEEDRWAIINYMLTL